MQNKRWFAYGSLLLSCSLFCTTTFADNQPQLDTENKPSVMVMDADTHDGWQDEMDDDTPTEVNVPIAQIRKFIEIYQIVKSNYVAPVTDDQLFENAMHGLVEDLDPYSHYLDAERYQQLLEFTEGQIARPNFQLKLDETQQVWHLDKIINNSDAYRLGLRDGQIVERINRVKLQDLDAKSVNQLLIGSLGSIMKIDIKNEQSIKNIDIVRDKKIEYDVEPYLTDELILVLKIKAFQKDTTQQIQDILKTYQAQTNLKGILIDLRDNPGGLLSTAVELADLFLEQGLIVSTKGRLEVPQRFQALPSAAPITYPIAILQNRYSASAAEVFTAALKEQGRAVVIGERSYGKGAIQKLLPLEHGALQLTVAHYYTPKGHLIEGKGVEPDEFLPILKSHTEQEILLQAIQVFHQILLKNQTTSLGNSP